MWISDGTVMLTCLWQSSTGLSPRVTWTAPLSFWSMSTMSTALSSTPGDLSASLQCTVSYCHLEAPTGTCSLMTVYIILLRGGRKKTSLIAPIFKVLKSICVISLKQKTVKLVSWFIFTDLILLLLLTVIQISPGCWFGTAVRRWLLYVVLGWVTIFARVNHLSAEPGTQAYSAWYFPPWVGGIEYQAKARGVNRHISCTLAHIRGLAVWAGVWLRTS